MNDGKFKAGNKGKPKGAVAKTTKLVKEVFADAFTELQQDKTANIITWAKANPTEFYKLASKLIPTQVNMEANIGVSDRPIKFK